MAKSIQAALEWIRRWQGVLGDSSGSIHVLALTTARPAEQTCLPFAISSLSDGDHNNDSTSTQCVVFTVRSKQDRDMDSTGSNKAQLVLSMLVGTLSLCASSSWVKPQYVTKPCFATASRNHNYRSLAPVSDSTTHISS